MNEIFIPETKYKEIEAKNSCGMIGENGTCRTFLFQNEEYVCTGGASKGSDPSWGWRSATRVVELSAYKGELKPLKYGDHWTDVDLGNRKREYTGMLVTQGKEKRQLVFVGPEIRFKKLEVGKQLTIF